MAERLGSVGERVLNLQLLSETYAISPKALMVNPAAETSIYIIGRQGSPMLLTPVPGSGTSGRSLCKSALLCSEKKSLTASLVVSGHLT